MTVVVIAALILGTAVIRHISRGHAFEKRTVRLMGITGLVLVIGGVISGFVSDAATSSVQADSVAFQEAVHPGFGSIVVGEKPMLPLLLFFAGILALALWAAFRQGARCRSSTMSSKRASARRPSKKQALNQKSSKNEPQHRIEVTLDAVLEKRE